MPHPTRFKRRLVHNAVIALLTLAVMLLLYYYLRERNNFLWRLGMLTAYASFGLLCCSLAIGPLNLLQGKVYQIHSDLRRDTGIWCAIISISHVVIGIQVHGNPWSYFFGESQLFVPRTDLWGLSNYLGLMATAIVALLLALSNDQAVRVRGAKRWKALQRTNYVYFALVVIHGIAYQLVESRETNLVIVFILAVVTVIAFQFIGFWKRRGTQSTQRVDRGKANDNP